MPLQYAHLRAARFGGDTTSASGTLPICSHVVTVTGVQSLDNFAAPTAIVPPLLNKKILFLRRAVLPQRGHLWGLISPLETRLHELFSATGCWQRYQVL